MTLSCDHPPAYPGALFAPVPGGYADRPIGCCLNPGWDGFSPGSRRTTPRCAVCHIWNRC